MTIIKICGIRTPDHAAAAVAAGADMIGMVFAPSRRQVTPGEAASIAGAAREAARIRGRAVELVGVFVNPTPAEVGAAIAAGELDAVQLSGDEAPHLAAALAPHPIIKAIRFDGSAVERAWLAPDAPAVRLLVDAHVPGSYGGAGVVADWERAAELAARRPLLLAGGLSPENVAAAIRRVLPWGVDVSSGVEADGVKDPRRIQAFVAAVRRAALAAGLGGASETATGDMPKPARTPV